MVCYLFLNAKFICAEFWKSNDIVAPDLLCSTFLFPKGPPPTLAPVKAPIRFLGLELCLVSPALRPSLLVAAMDDAGT